MTQNNLKLIFYPGRHGWTCIDSVDLVLTENDGFDPKTAWNSFFLPWSTWFDPYWLGGLGFDPKTAWNSFFTLVDMVWPVLTRWTRFWLKMTVLTRNGLKLIFYPGRHVLTRIDSVDSVLTENDGFDLKTHFFTWPTWFDLYWPGGIGSNGKMRLTREKYIFDFFFFLIFLDFYK